MPRFLNTSTGEFEWHDNPRLVDYAILSHTWRSPEDGGEQSFEGVRKIQAAVNEQMQRLRNGVVQEPNTIEIAPSAPSQDPIHSTPDTLRNPTITSVLSHPELSDKIREICKIAREAGFRLVWIDSCCIDKSSSAELSEAINSMFDWYRLADVCYVYLEDVPDVDHPIAHSGPVTDDTFRHSKWHTRGWTLQELIAPEHVVFLTQTWHFLGTRTALAVTIQQVTGIHFDILTGRAPLDSVSVARRLSWAAWRRTTRVEDEAYCLMGLFGVHISPIYGEGRNAFLRLQEEIVKTIPDQSIFAWGKCCTFLSCDKVMTEPGVVQGTVGLLAQSPRDFSSSRDVVPLAPTDFASRLRRRIKGAFPSVHCTFTPQGVRIELFCIDITPFPRFSNLFFAMKGLGTCKDCAARGRAHALALLQCQEKDGSLLALPLCHSQGDLLRGISVATHFMCSDRTHAPFHVVRLSKDALAELLEHLTPTPVEVFLLRHHVDPPKPKSRQPRFAAFMTYPRLALWPKEGDKGVPFSLSPNCTQELGVLGFSVTPLVCTREPEKIVLSTSLTSGPQDWWRTRFQQTVKLQVTLTRSTMWGQMRIFFDVQNGLRFLPWDDLEASGRSPEESTFDAGSPSPDLEEVPCVDGSASTSRTTAIFVDRNSERVWAEAEFIIHADPDWEMSAFDVRFLRIRLEHIMGDPEAGANPAQEIRLVIELSQKYRHFRATKDDTKSTLLDAGKGGSVNLYGALIGSSEAPLKAASSSEPLERSPSSLRREVAILFSLLHVRHTN